MADAATRIVLKTRPRTGFNAYPIANGVTIFEGQLCSLEGGYLNHWADGANDVFVGIVLGDAQGIEPGGALTGVDATPLPAARVDESGVTIMHHATLAGTPTQAKVGDLVYCADSDVANMTLTIGVRNHPIGYMSAFRTATDVDVTLFTPAEMLAQATA